MKNMCKRALALLFALSLLLTMTASAFAEEPETDPGQQESGTTPPENPEEGEGEEPAQEPDEPVPELLGEVTLYVSKVGCDETGDGSPALSAGTSLSSPRTSPSR